MKKLTKKSLDELAGTMPRISEIEQRSFIGGGNGTEESPYTVADYDNFLNNGPFPGGYVAFQSGVAASYVAPISGDYVITGDLLTKPTSTTYSFSWVHNYGELSSNALVSKIVSMIPGANLVLDLESAVNDWVTNILVGANYNMGEEFGVYTNGMGDICVCNQKGQQLGSRNWFTTNTTIDAHYSTGSLVSGSAH